MSPRANPGIIGATATILVLPKDSFEFKIGAPKLFSRQNQKGEQVYGLRYSLEITSEGPHTGKNIPVEQYFHSEKSFGMTKRFLMAALGYDMTSEGEEKFNQDHAETDFAVDTDEEYIAPIWKDIEGARIKADVDKSTYNGRDGNSFTWFAF